MKVLVVGNRPDSHEAVLVTEEDRDEIARWCGGTIAVDPEPDGAGWMVMWGGDRWSYHYDVARPGDYILCYPPGGDHFMTYDAGLFAEQFVPAAQIPLEAANVLGRILATVGEADHNVTLALLERLVTRTIFGGERDGKVVTMSPYIRGSEPAMSCWFCHLSLNPEVTPFVHAADCPWLAAMDLLDRPHPHDVAGTSWAAQ